MSDPARRAERADDRADIIRIRNDIPIEEDEGLEVEDIEEVPEPAQMTSTPIPTTSGQRLVSHDDFMELAREVQSQGRKLAKLSTQARKVGVKLKTAARTMRRVQAQYRQAFSHFHEEASGYRDNTGSMLQALADGASAYMAGININEAALNPSFLAISGVLDSYARQQPSLASLASLGGAFLRYLSYTNPLSNDATVVTAPSGSGSVAVTFT